MVIVMRMSSPIADVILLLSLFKKNSEGKPSCDFPNQKVWIYIWEVLNILAIVGLVVALGIIFYRKVKKMIFLSPKDGIPG